MLGPLSLTLAPQGNMVLRESIVVRCGRCGRAVRIAIAQFQKLRTYDCQQCLAAKEGHRLNTGHLGEEDGGSGGVATRGNPAAEAPRNLTKRERSMLLRKALGFSNEEIMRAYGASPCELRDLLIRAAHFTRGG